MAGAFIPGIDPELTGNFCTLEPVWQVKGEGNEARRGRNERDK
jgi:hypothetical protein